MSLPKAIQQQLEAAEALMSASAQADNAQAPEPQADAPTVSVNEEQARPSVEQTEPQQAAPATAPVAAKDDEGTWEQRYKSLQGLFNARVSELQASNKSLNQQVQQLTQKLETVLEQMSKQPETVQATVDPKDVENFGQDLVEMVRRQATAALAGIAAKVDGVVQAFEKRLSAVEQQLAGTSQAVTMTAEEVFFSKLAQLVPDWEQINADQRFLDWLAEEDPVYGQPRQAALTAAHKALDVRRVANIFNTFKSLFQQQAQAPKSVEKQVSPSTRAASVAPTPQEKPVISQAQIQAFYKDVATGKYRGREAEMQRLEQAINEAIAEGRVR